MEQSQIQTVEIILWILMNPIGEQTQAFLLRFQGDGIVDSILMDMELLHVSHQQYPQVVREAGAG